MNSLPEKLTAEQLSHLTKKHIDRYTSMLDRAQKGDRQFRAGECAALLKIWESIAKKNMSLVGTDYTDVEADEIGDAWFDEYDECDNPYDSEMDSAGKPCIPELCHYELRGKGRPWACHFALLWDSINGKKAPWVSNPFVWVVSFRRI